jgi:hypothetical protein
MTSTTPRTPPESPTSGPPAAGPPPPPEGTGRRLVSARSAIVAVLIALVIGAVLNAAGLRKTAQIQDEGWGRDVGIELTDPLARFSDSIGADRPRAALKSALGRSEDDRIVTEIEIPTPAPVAPPPPRARARRPARPTGPPPKPAFGPRRPLRLWVAGDSLAITPGYAILRAVEGNRAVRPVATVDGRLATGLERPDVFDWFRHVRGEVRRLRPKAVVLTFGANDDHGYMTALPKGATLDGFGGRRWTREYRRRVGGIMDEVVASGTRYLFWLGLPNSRSSAQSTRFRVLNRIYRAEAAKRPGRVFYIDLYDLLERRGKGYTDYLRVGGQLTKVRAGDGVHFERAGGDLVAREVVARFQRAFDLTAWRKPSRNP